MKESFKNKIFDIFDADDESIIAEHGMHQEAAPLRAILYSVVQSLKNYYLLDELYTNKHGSRYRKVAKDIQLQYFLKIHSTIEQISEQDYEYAVQFPLEQDAKDVVTALSFLKEYFIDLEYYEQCISINKLLILLLHN